jgi:hypothetical protein
MGECGAASATGEITHKVIHIPRRQLSGRLKQMNDLAMLSPNCVEQPREGRARIAADAR